MFCHQLPRHVYFSPTRILMGCFFAFLMLCLATSCKTPDQEVGGKLVIKESVPLPGVHDRLKVIVSAKEKEAEEARRLKAEQETGKKIKPIDRSRPDPENFRVKAGHWIAVQTEVLSEKKDFNGILEYGSGFDAKPLPQTSYTIGVQRPANLAKDQAKVITAPVFVPDTQRSTLATSLLNRRSFREASEFGTLQHLLPHQYNLVVLSDQPQSYQFLSRVPTIRNFKLNEDLDFYSAIGDETSFDSETGEDLQREIPLYLESMYYRLVFSNWNKRVELPSNAHQWTSTAFLIWGNYDPSQLTPDQKQAVLDWIHFGGQLIVSGESLDRLTDSFLSPYLPVEVTGLENALPETLMPMLEHWQKGVEGTTAIPGIATSSSIPVHSVRIKQGANEIDECGGLVVETTIGKGRIVVLRFPMNLKPLRSWSGFDNWFNCCLLRRPGRTFQNTSTQSDSPINVGSEQALKLRAFNWHGDRFDENDPAVATTFRMASRDWPFYQTDAKYRKLVGRSSKLAGSTNDPVDIAFSSAGGSQPLESSLGRRDVGNQILNDAFEGRFTAVPMVESPGQWSDRSGLATAARNTLRDYSGITPPSRNWVLVTLLMYLGVLVPLNYLVFRLMDRVEWAWAMTPVIAIGGGLMVVRAASLDIGFSNKQVEVTVLEIPAGYSRAHLTSYGAIYSSLTSFFTFKSENATTVMLPFVVRVDSSKKMKKEPSEFLFEYSQQPSFGPLRVQSNTTDMYHMEQFVDIGGAIRIDQDSVGNWVLHNGTTMSLKNVGVLWAKPGSRVLHYAMFDDLLAGRKQSVAWKEMAPDHPASSLWDGTQLADPDIPLMRLIKRIEDLAGEELLRVSVDDCVTHIASFDTQLARKLRLRTERSQKAKKTPEAANIESFLKEILRKDRLSSELKLGDLQAQASRRPFGRGEIRLISWTDHLMGQMEISPSPTQQQRRSLVIAQLRLPETPDFESDRNTALLANKTEVETDQE